MTNFSPKRAFVMFLGIGAGLLALIGRVAYLETYGQQRTIARAERQQSQVQVYPARPGSIFDANGFQFAGTVQTRSVYVDPKFMLQEYTNEESERGDMGKDLADLARTLDVRPDALREKIESSFNKRFVRIADNVDERSCEEVRKLDMPGVGVMFVPQRSYPMGSIGAHLLGGVGKDGVGLEGLEMKFAKVLRGHDGSAKVQKDARRRPIATPMEDYVAPEHGKHLVLTIDANIQMIAEQELAAACEKYKGKRGEVVVMDPRTGDVLALANWPTFNPQNLEDSTPDVRRNRCLTDPYEPGSTIKPFIMGPALAWHVTRVNEVWPIPGISWRTYYGRKVTDVHGYGPLSSWDGLVKSSNILMSMLGERMGNDKLFAALTGFRFGQRTGLELPGEDDGRVNPLKKWNKYSTESIAQGYELMVTPVQLARAFSAYANGGRLVQPRVIKGVLDADGNVITRQQRVRLEELPQVIDPAAAGQLRRVMCDVVIRGTATHARSDVWNLFGKTGTAHISEGRGGYSQTKFTSSFIGGGPYENPRLVIAFVVHEADRRIAHYGGTVSAPNAGRVLERSLAYLQVPASPDMTLPPPDVARVLFNYDPKVYSSKSVASARE